MMSYGNYVCKIASLEEMEQKWDDEIALHSEKENWIAWKSEAIEGARAGHSMQTGELVQVSRSQVL